MAMLIRDRRESCEKITGSRDDLALAADKSSPPEAAEFAQAYKRLTVMTESPVFVDSALAMLCRGASEREVEEARKKSGPHAHTRITIYMNDFAAAAFKRTSTPYPVGSVIVKGKTVQGYHGNDGKTATTHDGIGGTIKRPSGFEAKHGDWEYFYFEDTSKIESGKIASCVQCHAAASAKDYVFGTWSKP